MEYFAITSLTEFAGLLVAVFGAFGTLLFGFYRYAEAREKDFAKSRRIESEAFRTTIEELSKSIDNQTRSIDKQTKSSEKVAKATTKSAKEAEQRNGHLAELAIENTEKLMEALISIKTQNVAEQHVEHQTINDKE